MSPYFPDRHLYLIYDKKKIDYRYAIYLNKMNEFPIFTVTRGRTARCRFIGVCQQTRFAECHECGRINRETSSKSITKQKCNKN